MHSMFCIISLFLHSRFSSFVNTSLSFNPQSIIQTNNAANRKQRDGFKTFLFFVRLTSLARFCFVTLSIFQLVTVGYFPKSLHQVKSNATRQSNPVMLNTVFQTLSIYSYTLFTFAITFASSNPIPQYRVFH